jgi:cell wall-associated NlpC family hydrolase
VTRLTAGGRHRAPSRIALALAQGRYSATSTFSVAASGGILASSFLVATTQAQDDLHAAMAALDPVVGPGVAAAGPPEIAASAHTASRDTAATAFSATVLPRSADAVALPGDVETVAERIDRPARAVAAPAEAEVAPVGELGFVGVTPAPEPVVEAQAPASSESEAPVTSASEARSETTASRSDSRQSAPATAPAAPAPAPAPTPAPAPAPKPAPAPAPSGGAEGAIGWAYNHLGLPYIYGSDSGSGFDCSGFVKAAYAAAGVSLPHGSSLQYSATTRISLSNIQRGDLLFYSQGSGIYHVAIYLGNGQVIHSLREWGGGFNGSKVSDMNYSPGLFAAGRP